MTYSTLYLESLFFESNFAKCFPSEKEIRRMTLVNFVSEQVGDNEWIKLILVLIQNDVDTLEKLYKMDLSDLTKYKNIDIQKANVISKLQSIMLETINENQERRKENI